MEEIRCRQCGSTNITREGWFYVCQNCRSKYSLDASGIESEKLDNFMESGCTAFNNGDYRNAKYFFKNALDINPKHGKAYHFYNLAADLDFLSKKSQKNVEILCNGLKGKMGTVFDMYHTVSDKVAKNNLLDGAINNFDLLCRQIADIIISSDFKKSGINTIIDAYQYGIDKLVSNNEDETVIRKLKDRKSQFLEQTNRLFGSVTTDYSSHPGSNGMKNNTENSYRGFYFDFELVAKIVHILAIAVFLVLTVLSIKNGWGLPSIIFYGFSTLVCMFGTYQLFDYRDELPLFLRTVLWIVIAYFAMFDFGTGIATLWRIILSLIILVFTQQIFDNIS